MVAQTLSSIAPAPAKSMKVVPISQTKSSKPKLSFDTAKDLFQTECGLKLVSLSDASVGSSEAYIAEIERDASYDAADTSNGCSRRTIPTEETKVVLRVFRPVPNFATLRTENACAMLRYIEQQNPELPVPRVYTWNSDSKNRFGFEYAIEQSMPGISLEKAGSIISSEADMDAIFVDLAKVVAELKRIPSPEGKYGGIRMDGGTDTFRAADGPLGYGSPSTSPREHYEKYLGAQRRTAAESDILKDYASRPNLGSRLTESYLKELVAGTLRTIDDELMKPVLVHGCIDAHTILVDPSNNRVTGLVNFELSYFGPAIEEYFLSYLGTSTTTAGDVKAFLVNPFEAVACESEHRYWRSLLATSASSSDHPTGPPEELTPRTALFLRTLKSEGALVPGDLPFLRLSMLYWFGQDLCPWMFTEKMTCECWSEKTVEERVSNACDALEWFIEEFEKTI